MPLKIPLQLVNNTDISRTQEPVTIGIPIAKGDIFNSDKFFVEDSSGNRLSAYIAPTAYWSDGSIKWILLDFQISLGHNDSTRVFVNKDGDDKNNNKPSHTQIIINEDDKKIVVNTGQAEFTLSKHQFSPIAQVRISGRDLLTPDASKIRFTDINGFEASASITSISCRDPENSLRRDFDLKGSFHANNEELLAEFNLVLSFYAGKTYVKLDFAIMNPHAAKHKPGFWDLGDAGSLFFKDLSVDLLLNRPEDPMEIMVKEMQKGGTHLFRSDNLLIYQDSSGGENWQSKNHINHRGCVPLKFKGYKFFDDGKRVDSGDRAQPIIRLSSANQTLCAHLCNFWQNFPKALEVNRNRLSLKLFPEQFSDVFELQGGEQKTHTLYLDFSNDSESLEWVINPTQAKIPLEFYAQSEVFPYLPASYEDTAIQNLIQQGLQGDNNFFEKREAIDEYGWRNFGDIFADHEYLLYKGSDPLISHYNNQYDACYGMIRQYIMTGDNKWYELASNLLQHVVDIDIYHTSEDRDELNFGLFWHTAHYLNAYTCTHRTFSNHQFDDEMSYKTGGGGPGAEHCYTTGLAYSYFLTGNPAFKEAAMNLVEWITIVMEGSDTVIERVINFIKRDIPILKKLISGQKIPKFRYPFTRATGNYITTLIDAFSLTGKCEYLTKVEKVIEQSIHPREDISLRKLDDIEAGWSYLVLLQAIGKYLEVKLQNDEIDEPYFYARDSLIHYADWMVENEYPFLEKPERLEFPNHTWVAQDLRKANILFGASCYDSVNKDIYVKKARYFVDYVAKELGKEKTSYYSRILIILMQNDIHESSLENKQENRQIDLKVSISYSLPSHYSVFGILLDFVKDIVARTINLSIVKEKRWIAFRFKA